MRRALFIPPFDELAEPAVLVELAVAAEEAGWDGVFLWDHILRADPPRPIADPWVAMAAMAMVTTTLRIGALVTPLVRRRPAKLAREIVTLDRLSRGRLVVGLGLGVDSGRELSAFGELVDERARGDLLDEGLELLMAMLSGEEVTFRGEHFVADRVTLLPAPLQQPHPPMWMATRTMNRRPLRRAASTQGIVPIEQSPEAVAEMLRVIAEHRGSLDGFDVVVSRSGPWSLDEWAAVGATWWLEDAPLGTTAAEAMALVEHPEGP